LNWLQVELKKVWKSLKKLALAIDATTIQFKMSYFPKIDQPVYGIIQ
jgi:hypothetical protein